MKLSVPYVEKLMIPWVIPKNQFTKFGINQKNIIQYRSIDAPQLLKEMFQRMLNFHSIKRKDDFD